MVLWADDLKRRPCLFWCEWVCVEGGSGPWFVAVALHHIGFPARPPFFRIVASALGVVCDRAVQAASAFRVLPFVLANRTPEGGGGGLRPPIDSGRRPALYAFSVEGNSDGFVPCQLDWAIICLKHFE